MSSIERNRAAWNHLVAGGTPFAKVATDEECREPLKALDGRGWLAGSVADKEVLCLAAGGGWQSILYAAAGACVTVVDLSPAMLELDTREASRRNYQVRCVEASMDDLSALGDATFDIVHQPVSTCYVPDICAVYCEIARVIRDGGTYISQHKQPGSLQVTGRDSRNRYVLGVNYYHTGPLPPAEDRSYRETGTTEFLHRWEDLVGGLCQSGFVIEALSEPYRGDPKAPIGHFGHRGTFVAPYLRMKARRVRRTEKPAKENTLWMP